DLERPVRLYQLAADGLPAEFPPLRHQLPEGLPIGRRRLALAAVALLLIAAAVVAAILSTGSAGAINVRPNAVGVIDPRTNKVIDQVPVGVRPDAIAAGAGSVWVANDEDRTVSRIDPSARSLV